MPGVPWRSVDSYFPFTNPSFEVEGRFDGTWKEVLGFGLVEKEILSSTSVVDVAWAIGIGLDRLAMMLFSIPDIRYMWSTNSKFMSQFEGRNSHTTFVPFSNVPSIAKDLSFWVESSDVTVNSGDWLWNREADFFEFLREATGDLVEEIITLDSYTHPDSGRFSKTYRIILSSPSFVKNPALFQNTANRLLREIVSNVSQRFNVSVRQVGSN